jgi:protein-tyrosine phosphatase
LQAKSPQLNISSAGIKALVDKPIYPSAAHELSNNGYVNQNHNARQLDGWMVAQADLILVMEKFQQQRLMSEYPAASGRIMLLGQWQDNLEINDPYRKSAEVFSLVFKQIEQACASWSKKLG